MAISALQICVFLDAGNYRKRVLQKIAKELGLPKLTFQVLRQSAATLAATLGNVKDIQGLLRYQRAVTTTDVCIQQNPEGVRPP
jgi:hypothetical protein